MVIKNVESKKVDLLLKERQLLLEKRIDNTLTQLTKNVQILSVDYSLWDEMVMFIKNRDQQWAKNNIITAMYHFNADIFFVLDENTKIVFSECTLENKNILQLSSLGLNLDLLFKKKFFNHFFVKKNNVLIEFFTAPVQPVRDTKRITTPKGFLIVGKKWENKELIEISDLLGADVKILTARLDEKNSSIINHEEYIISSQRIFVDWQNRNIAKLQINSNVSIAKEIVRLNSNLFNILMLIGILLLAFLSYFLIFYFVKPIRIISNVLKNEAITKSNEVSQQFSEFSDSDLVKLISKFINQKNLLEREIDSKSKIEKDLSFRAEFEDLVASISTTFINSDTTEIDKDISNTLLIIGNFIKADRSYVFTFENNYKMMSNKYEWCDKEIEPQINNLQNLPTNIFPWWMSKLMIFESINIRDINSLPSEAVSEKEILLQKGIKSIIVVPMISSNQLLGFVGFDSVKEYKEWTENTVRLLKMVGDIFSNALEKKKVELALANSEKQYRNLVNNLKEVIFKTNSEGMWTFLNPAWTEITGFTVDETLGTNFLNYVYTEDRQKNYELFIPLIERQKEYCRHTIRYNTKYGGTKWIEVHARLILNDRGQIEGITGSLNDVTDRILVEYARKKAEDEIIKSLEREKELNEMKSRFVSMISHEFRTPLTTIFSSTELIERYQSKWSEEKKREHISRIKKSCINLTEMLNLVLTLNKAEAGKLTNNPELMNLNSFFEDLVSEFQLQCQNNHQIIFTNYGFWDDVLMDEKLLRHIFTNLLSNAIKYSPNGGQISLDLIPVNEKILFKISDQGIGIPIKEQQNLFQMFYRANNVGNINGTGLGLAIIKKSVEVLEGSISFESEEGKGTTFFIYLPVTNKKDL
jgi:PAS domain S-box-containing protein